MNQYLFSPILFFLSGICISNAYFPITPKMFRAQDTSYSPYPFNCNLSKTVLNAAIRKTRIIEERSASSLDSDNTFGSSTGNKKSSAIKKIKSFSSKTENQAAYVELMRDDEVDIIIVSGPAGTGKTMLACYAAVEALKLGKVRKIVITRPVVSVDEEIGFLPGGLTSKMDPWTRPAFDALRETYSPKEIENMIDEGVIEIVPLGFMRGRTFKHAWIVADEMQNSTPMQMLMLATRIGEGSKMIITGDLNQSDRVGLNGLHVIREKILGQKANVASCVRVIELRSEDVQRSRAAKAILDIYDPPVEKGTCDSPANKPTSQEWTAADFNDAALIPLKHLTKKDREELR